MRYWNNNAKISDFEKHLKLIDFLIIGNLNATTYKEVFEALKNNEIRWGITLGSGKMPYFKVPDDYDFANERFEVREDGYYKQVNGANWWTNLVPDSLPPPLKLTKKFNEIDYKKYDNYDAIEVSRVKDIPCNFDAVMGVPVTFLDKHCPEQFEVIGVYNDFRSEFDGGISGFPIYIDEKHPRWQGPSVNYKPKYARIIIKRKNNDKN